MSARRITVVSYAINGRGMGHLVRQLAILRQMRRLCAVLDVALEAWVLTTSEADTLARREGFAALKLPSKAMMRDAALDPVRYLAIQRAWVIQTLAALQPDLLLVDTFPGGSQGELLAGLELAKHRVLVSRAVREDFAETDPFAGLVSLYQRVVYPDERGTGPILLRDREELLPRGDARAALGVPDDRRAVYVSLGGGGDLSAAGTLPRLVGPLVARGWHVVVGAGPLYVGPELRGPGITWLDRYAPIELFSALDAAISAAGYNSFSELMYCGVPTVFLPQPRLADDQAARAREAEAAGAGRVARTVEEALALVESPGDPAAAAGLIPKNGARAAALLALELVIPAADLALADGLLDPALVAHLDRSGGHDGARHALSMLRLFAGGTPAEHREQRAALAGLAERGIPVPKLPEIDGVGLLRQFFALTARLGAPVDLSCRMAEELARRLPGTRGTALLAFLDPLFTTVARFDDWMGALALIRALPIQRGVPIEVLLPPLLRWIGRQDDLFDAVRDFSRLEGGGRRPTIEVLALLAQEGA